MVLVVKNPSAYAGDLTGMGLIPASGRSPGGGHGNAPQYCCMENPMDRGAWRAISHRVAKSWTQLKQVSTHAQLWSHCLTLLNPMDCSTPDASLLHCLLEFAHLRYMSMESVMLSNNLLIMLSLQDLVLRKDQYFPPWTDLYPIVLHLCWSNITSYCGKTNTT